MAMASLIFWGIIGYIGYLIGYQQATQRTQRKFLPPGPKPFPVLGNIKDLPPDGELEYKHWLSHKDLYGGISSVTVMGMTMVPIHDKKMAHDILELNASKASGRPSMVMANKLCGYESIVLCQGYTPMFRRYRKYLHRELGTKVSAEKYRDVQEIEVNRQLVRALNEPGKWLEHFKTNAGATVLKMAYGYTVEPHKPDPLVDLTDKMMAEFSLAAVPMAWAVDIIPALQYLPDNFPGATFKQTARKWKKSIHATGYIPYDFVKKQMSSFTYKPSYVSKLVQQIEHENNAKLSHDDEEAIIWSAASLYGAAADTTVITLSVFTLAMIKFPEVQRRAQEEIDRVVGRDRLPSFADRDNLPYINGVVKEAMRWWPIAPMGFPHLATEDIEYNGYHIPKGSFLLPAVWWFLHDPEVYPDPENFDPERYMEPRNEPDPMTEAFGYGRRICPGRFFADNGLFLNIAQSLAAFSINHALDKDGQPIPITSQQKPGILTYLTEDFACDIKPRSEQHVELIRKFEREHPWEASDADQLQSLDTFEVRE